MGMEVPESMYIHEPALWVRLETDASNARTVRGISFSATEIPAGNRRDVRIWILTLKVPEKLQLYGLYVYYVVHICDFGMLKVIRPFCRPKFWSCVDLLSF